MRDRKLNLEDRRRKLASWTAGLAAGLTAALGLTALLLVAPGSAAPSDPPNRGADGAAGAVAAAPGQPAGPESQARTEDAQAQDVQEEVSRRLTEQRQERLREAQSALEESNMALAALAEGRSRDALEALARAIGKLELIVARDPELAFAPVDVHVTTHDLDASPQEIRETRDLAVEMLEEGRVQEARAALAGLASEIVVTTTSLPLATYPEAIKAISPLIDRGEFDAARRALGAALGTVVVTQEVISLPTMRAGLALQELKALVDAEPDDGAELSDAAQARALLDETRRQIEIAQLLGYGNEALYRSLDSEVEELASRIEDGKETVGVFASLRRSLDDLQSSFLR